MHTTFFSARGSKQWQRVSRSSEQLPRNPQATLQRVLWTDLHKYVVSDTRDPSLGPQA